MIELLITVAIIGLLSAIAIPLMVNALNRAQQSSTAARIRILAGFIEQYIHSHPEVGSPKFNDVIELNDKLRELQISNNEVVIYDGWDNELIYVAEAGLATHGYSIISYGEDAAPGPAPTLEGVTSYFDEDIIWADGGFIQLPRGLQKRR